MINIKSLYSSWLPDDATAESLKKRAAQFGEEAKAFLCRHKMAIGVVSALVIGIGIGVLLNRGEAPVVQDPQTISPDTQKTIDALKEQIQSLQKKLGTKEGSHLILKQELANCRAEGAANLQAKTQEYMLNLDVVRQQNQALVEAKETQIGLLNQAIETCKKEVLDANAFRSTFENLVVKSIKV